MRVVIFTTAVLVVLVTTGTRPGQVVLRVHVEMPDLVVQLSIDVQIWHFRGDQRIQDGDGRLLLEFDDDVGVWQFPFLEVDNSNLVD